MQERQQIAQCSCTSRIAVWTARLTSLLTVNGSPALTHTLTSRVVRDQGGLGVMAVAFDRSSAMSRFGGVPN